MPRLFAIVVLASAAAGIAHADLSPPNHKPYKHEYVIANLDQYPDYVFIVASGGERDQLAAGKAFSFKWSSLNDYQRTLDAVPRARFAESGTSYREKSSLPLGVIRLAPTPFMSRDTNPIDDPAVRVVTTYNIELINSNIRLHHVADQRYDADGNLIGPYRGAFATGAEGAFAAGAEGMSRTPWIGAGLAAAAALVGMALVWLQRAYSARRRAATEAGAGQ